MIKDAKLLQKIETEHIRKSKTSFESRISEFRAMYKHYRAISKDSRKNPMDGIETAIKIARAINSVR